MEEKRKILILSYYWPPSGGAGVQRILKFAKYLPQFGFKPYVITVDGQVASYPILDTSLLNEVPAGLEVLRTNSFEPLNMLTKLTGNKAPYGGFANKDKDKFSQRVLRFVRGNFFIPDARKGWVKHAYAKAAELIEAEKINTLLISSPPHSSQLIGLKLKKKFPQLKWIADLRDPWTDIFYYNDMLHTKMALAKDAAFEKQVVEQADELIVVSKPILTNYLSKSNLIDEKKIHVIPNGFDEDDFPPGKQSINEAFTITYVGTIADIYNPKMFFECLAMAMASHPDKKIKLRFVGGRTENIISMVRENKLDDITEFVPHVKHETAIGYMTSSDALLLVIPDVPDSHGILTGKLFEYMAAKRPIICIGARNGDAAKIIEECEAGKTFERSERSALTAHLIELLSQSADNKKMIRQSPTFEKYSRKNLTQQLAAIISGSLPSDKR
ncbi:MAG: glycosyltransferase family 4 protein [Bacteroidota bacterium]